VRPIPFWPCKWLYERHSIFRHLVSSANKRELKDIPPTAQTEKMTDPLCPRTFRVSESSLGWSQQRVIQDPVIRTSASSNRPVWSSQHAGDRPAETGVTAGRILNRPSVGGQHGHHGPR